MKLTQIRDAMKFTPEKAAKNLVATGEHCRVTLWCLEIGQEIHPHTHDGDHVWVVWEGTGWFLTEGGRTPVEPGSVLFAPEGESHGMAADTRLVFVSVSAGEHA